MISLRKFNITTKLLLLLAPILLVSGCSTVSHTPTASTKAAALAQAEPGPDRLLRYCRRMADTNNLRIAIGVCKRALEAAPENPAPVLVLADAYLSAHQEEDAAEAFRYALSIDPVNSSAHYGLGKLYLKKAQHADARLHLEAALSGAAENPAIYNALGILNDQLGEHAAAQTFYRSGLVIDPENIALSNNLGVSLLLSERLSEGMNVLGSVGAQHRPNETRRRNLAAAQEAIAAYEAASHNPAPALAAKDHVVTSVLQTVETVSAPKTTQNDTDVPHQKPFERLSVSKTPLAKVKARHSAPPSIETSAAVITAAAPQATDRRAATPVVLDSIQATQNLGLDPVITPAPVIVVNFQELAPLEVKSPKIRAARTVTPAPTTIVAEILPDLPHAAKASTTLDLATILPHRKPLTLAAAEVQFRNDFVSVVAETAVPGPSLVHPEMEITPQTEISRELLVVDVPHLPIDARGEDQGATSTPGVQTEPDLRAARPVFVPERTMLSSSLPQDLALDDDVSFEGELLYRLDPIQLVNLTPSDVPSTRTPFEIGYLFEVRETLPLRAIASKGDAQSLRLARYHQGDDVGRESRTHTETERGSGSQPAIEWPLDQASLPTTADHVDPLRDREAPQAPGIPVPDWSNLIATRETPSNPGPAPGSERLLALMMIQRETFSTA